ncbi:MAG: hypothetical protein KBF45_06335 [Cyclobacteriaceae bacterium]|jgi:hypothetical protein|nr:hypothetical protein [Cyclobacteriaceae bacterium]
MKKFLLFSVALVAFSCGKPLPDLSPIDLPQWKEDRGGCKSIRASFLSDLISQKEELKGLSEDAIIELLGRPDRNELYKRNQKFYYYDLEPGKPCDSTAHNQQLILRFNAMGMAKEVAIEVVD